MKAKNRSIETIDIKRIFLSLEYNTMAYLGKLIVHFENEIPESPGEREVAVNPVGVHVTARLGDALQFQLVVWFVVVGEGDGFASNPGDASRISGIGTPQSVALQQDSDGGAASHLVLEVAVDLHGPVALEE